MASLTIRDLPDRTLASLKTRADMNHRSLNGEMLYILDYVVSGRSEFDMIREFCEANPKLAKDAAFDAYLKFGGMPFLSYLALNELPSVDYLNDLYSSILMKDIVKRHKIRDVDLLTRIVGYLMSETGHTFSAARISTTAFPPSSWRRSRGTSIRGTPASWRTCSSAGMPQKKIANEILKVSENTMKKML